MFNNIIQNELKVVKRRICKLLGERGYIKIKKAKGKPFQWECIHKGRCGRPEGAEADRL